LKFNLEQNPDLWKKLLAKELSPRIFARMTLDQLLSDEALKKKRERIEKLQKRRDLGLGCDTVGEGVFRCRECKSKQIRVHQQQTRSADEPMTTFLQCAKCGKRWRE